jgi:hypothetical protein
MSDVAPNRVAADEGTNGLKFLVIEFCWLDSTVSTAELLPELPAFVEFDVPPQAAIRSAAASREHTAPSCLDLIQRFIEQYTFLSGKRGMSRMWTVMCPG